MRDNSSIVLGAMIPIAFAIIFILGHSYGKLSVAEECQKFGAFSRYDKMYECKEKK